MRVQLVRLASAITFAAAAATLAVPSAAQAGTSTSPLIWVWESSWSSRAACQEARTDLYYQGIGYSRTQCLYTGLGSKPWALQVRY